VSQRLEETVIVKVKDGKVVSKTFKYELTRKPLVGIWITAYDPKQSRLYMERLDLE
jgi:hypothetical protein